MRVAVPWSLSHYIPLNGFHPLYRALVDHAPPKVSLHAWDNVELFERLGANGAVRGALIKAADREREKIRAHAEGTVAKAYEEHFGAPNRALTAELAGDIEFHHTAPFPSLERPFVFHCESFAPVFLPFAEQGGEALARADELRAHYLRVLGHPLCLGIFSHIPETLDNLSRFFSDPEIDRRLHRSRIGLSAKTGSDAAAPDPASLARPTFLFINSAHQDVRNFFLRGGHVVLRFWQAFKQTGREGILFMRCAKPDDAALKAHGIDVQFLTAETGRSVLWIQDYLASHELDALLAQAHFFLLPSLSLHSVSIMQAMAAGVVPVVTDTIGTASYVTDERTGVVLHGVREAIMRPDPTTGILVDSYRNAIDLAQPLATQLMARIVDFLDAPHAYWQLRERCRAQARQQFSGEAFADEFWAAVSDRYGRYRSEQGDAQAAARRAVQGQALSDCLLKGERWAAVFETATRPMRRIYTGHSSVFEYGGAFVHVYGNPRMAMSDWSPLSQYYDPDAQPTTFARSLSDLRGIYLASGDMAQAGAGRHWFVEMASRMLMPVPGLHSLAAGIFRFLRRRRRWLPSSAGAPDGGEDIELMRQGVHGFNVIRYARRYYAIPQGEGAFEPAKVKSKGYSSCFSGGSVEEVLRQIRAKAARPHAAAPPVQRREAPVELVVEGWHGFNIVQVEAKFYAILQRDGAFRIDKAVANGYRCMFSGDSAQEVQDLVLSFVASNPPRQWGWRRKYVKQTLNSSLDI